MLNVFSDFPLNFSAVILVILLMFVCPFVTTLEVIPILFWNCMGIVPLETICLRSSHEVIANMVCRGRLPVCYNTETAEHISITYGFVVAI